MSHVSRAFYGSPWALDQRKLREVERVIRARFYVQRGAGRPKRIKANIKPPAAGPAAEKPYAMYGRVAILKLYGVISQRMSWLDDISGGTSTEMFARRLDYALADQDVSSIILDCDSPGGCVYGVPEVADRLFAARKAKRVVAIVNPLCASAGYWIASAAQEMILTPSGHVGSIGVYVLHEDLSQAALMAGVDPTFIYAGKYKVEGNYLEPLGEEAKAAIQADVDHYYSLFVDAVARHRGTTPEAVRNGYGQGRVLNSSSAVEQKLVDRIGTYDEVLADENRRASSNTIISTNAAKQRQAEAELED